MGYAPTNQPRTLRKIHLALLPFFAALPLWAVSNGDTLEAVIAEKGEPNSKLERGNITLLTYDDATIRLESGKVAAQKSPQAESATPHHGTSGPGMSGEWTTDYQSALAAASGSGRSICLFFTGSDWCGWCKRLEAEVLSTEDFKEYASGNLVLVKLDFPRRIPQSEFTKKRNQKLTEKYQVGGFPTIVVVDESGEELGRIGYQEGGPRPFIKKLQKM